MQIIIGQGIDNLKFGLTPQQVLDSWGVADKEYEDENGDKFFAYFDQKVALRFDKEHQFKLCWIECTNPKTNLLGANVFELEPDQVTYLIEQEEAEEPEFHEFGWLETFFYPREWLELQFQFGDLSAVNFGVFYDEKDRPEWP